MDKSWCRVKFVRVEKFYYTTQRSNKPISYHIASGIRPILMLVTIQCVSRKMKSFNYHLTDSPCSTSYLTFCPVSIGKKYL